MRLSACSREKEVKELLELGQWPQACGAELQAHVDGCRSCREMVLVTTAFAALLVGGFLVLKLAG